jgi:hypothetical protein
MTWRAIFARPYCVEAVKTPYSANCKTLPDVFPPPPPSPPPPPPKVTPPPPPMLPRCCNANSNIFGYEDDQCCHPEKLHIIGGKRCGSSRWCDPGPLPKGSANEDDPNFMRSGTQTCIDFLSPRINPKDKRCRSQPKALSPPPLPPPPPSPLKPILPGCCNPNYKSTGIFPDQCCDSATLQIKRGTQCMSSRWCDVGVPGGADAKKIPCDVAQRDIPNSERCDEQPTLMPPPPPQPPSPPPITAPPLPPNPAGCCNPNFKPFGFQSSQCCHPTSLLILEGDRCM